MIHFFVEDTSYNPRELHATPQWLARVAADFQTSIFAINFIFCSDDYLLIINREHLNHDYYTDIITFDHRDSFDQPLESDIFISIDRVSDNAAQLGYSFFTELLRVMVHGVLHLLGMNDHSENDQQQMRTVEDKYVQLYFQLFHSLK